MSIRTRKFMASAAAALAAGALAGPAVAGTPSDEEYGNPLSEEASGGGSEGTLGAEATSGDLPFTGFETFAVLAGGLGLATAGLVLRRVSRARS
ncbi:MAG: hypothetical protein R3C15_05955 [Thermoleophilia bacterium]